MQSGNWPTEYAFEAHYYGDNSGKHNEGVDSTIIVLMMSFPLWSIRALTVSRQGWLDQSSFLRACLRFLLYWGQMLTLPPRLRMSGFVLHPRISLE